MVFFVIVCVIIQDNNGNFIGLLDGVWGDFYFVDFDMFSEFGGLSSNVGVFMNMDIFFVNFFSSVVMVVIEGFINVCVVFFCMVSIIVLILNMGSVSSVGVLINLIIIYMGILLMGIILIFYNVFLVVDENYIGNLINYIELGIVYVFF